MNVKFSISNQPLSKKGSAESGDQSQEYVSIVPFLASINFPIRGLENNKVSNSIQVAEITTFSGSGDRKQKANYSRRSPYISPSSNLKFPIPIKKVTMQIKSLTHIDVFLSQTDQTGHSRSAHYSNSPRFSGPRGNFWQAQIFPAGITPFLVQANKFR